jgi:hypothetical protein
LDVKLIGSFPAQVPGLAVSVCPTVGVTEIVGGLVFAGAPGAAPTRAVWVERATVHPLASVAFTWMRIGNSWSSGTGTYV